MVAKSVKLTRTKQSHRILEKIVREWQAWQADAWKPAYTDDS